MRRCSKRRRDVYKRQWEIWGRTIFKEIKALHANSVGFTFPFYTDGHTANTYYPKLVCNSEYNTPDPTLSLIHI